MSYSGKSGCYMAFYNPTLGTKLTSGKLTANSWYIISEIAASGTALPAGLPIDAPFKTGNTAPTLANGDNVLPVNLGSAIAKTEVGLQFNQNVIETTNSGDDCFMSSVPDGIIQITATLDGILRYNKETEEMEDFSIAMFNQFANRITDDGKGNYTYTMAETKEFLAFILLNKDAKLGQTQNFIVTNVFFTSLDIGGAQTDIQKRTITVNKGSGRIYWYRRVAGSSDII